MHIRQSIADGNVVYLTTGCGRMKEILRNDENGSDYLSFERSMAMDATSSAAITPEHQAVAGCRLVITHSDMTQRLYRHFFREFEGKIAREVVWFAEWIYAEALNHASAARAFADRTIDVLFVARSWYRDEKNYALLREIVPRMSQLNVHIVGETQDDIAGATHSHFVANRGKLFELMGNAKAVACPSKFDAAPGILFEASALGCNVVASKNCGNWMICCEELIAESLQPSAFAAAILRAGERKYDDRVEYFFRQAGYRKLLTILGGE